MDANRELLQSIYENAEIGRDVIGHLIKLCEDAEFRCVLAQEFAEYHKILTETERRMLQHAQLPKKARQALRAPIYASLSINVRIDKTSSHLAEMMMQGSLMGMIDMLRDIRKYERAEEETLLLARRLAAVEENALWELKGYL